MTSRRCQSLAFCTLALLSGTGWAACRDLPVDLQTSTTPIYIPRDAPVGSIISSMVTNYDSTRDRECNDKLVIHQMLAGPHLPAMTVATSTEIKNIGEHLYATNVPGVGIGVGHASGKLCESPDVPYSGSRFFPFTARSCSGRTYQTRVYSYLYKTGPIAAGVHTLNLDVFRVLFNGEVQSSLTLATTLTVAGCSMPAFSSNQIEVKMLPTTISDFSGPGTVGPAKPFMISMFSCVRGNYSPYYPWNYFQGNYANVRLEPARGSTVIDAQNGIVSLKPDATAQGIAVQILKQDMTAMTLGSEVQIKHVEDGITTLPFHARYIQVGDGKPQGGSADATVNFTVTFR